MSAPKAPDPNATAQGQLGYNKQAAQSTMQMNMVNQNNPFGSLAYSQSGMTADGTPQFTANTTYTPEVQSQIDSLMGKISSSAGKDPTQIQMDLYQKYMDPIFNKQRDAQESQRWNQGIRPGSTQHGDAVNLQERNINDAYTNFMLQSRGQAANETMLPYQELAALRGATAPEWVQTPQAQIAPPDYAGAVNNNYNAKSQQYGSMMSGLFSVPSAALGGWARGGFSNPFGNSSSGSAGR